MPEIFFSCKMRICIASLRYCIMNHVYNQICSLSICLCSSVCMCVTNVARTSVLGFMLSKAKLTPLTQLLVVCVLLLWNLGFCSLSVRPEQCFSWYRSSFRPAPVA